MEKFIYNSETFSNPEKAARLFAKNESEAKERYEYLNKLVTLWKNRRVIPLTKIML